MWKKDEGSGKCIDDENGSDSCCSKDKRETHFLMAQEVQSEKKMSKSDSWAQSRVKYVFGSDDEGDTSREDCRFDSGNQSSVNSDEEEKVEAEVDLEGVLVSALEELIRVRKEYKNCKNAAIEEQDQLNKCLEDSEQSIKNLKT